MDTEQSKAEADRILSEAGWTTTLKPPWRGHHWAEGMVGGRAPNGDAYVKAFTSFPQADAAAMELDPADYPDTYHEAAAWLVEHAEPKEAANDLSSDMTLEPLRTVALAEDPHADMTPPQDAGHSLFGEPDMAQPININVAPVFNVGGSHSESGATNETHGEAGEGAASGEAILGGGLPPDDVAPELGLGEDLGASGGEPEPQQVEAGEVDETPLPESPPADAPAEAAQDHVDSGSDAIAVEGAEDLGSADDGSASGGLALYADDGQDGPDFGDADYAVDADYEEIGDDSEDLALIEGADLGAEILDEAQAEQSASGVAYFGDDIHIARLAKMGRLLELATEHKASLQEGWTLDEFRSLQNLIVRIDRGEAPDDPAARERFDHIGAYSRAMSRIDAFLAEREGELEGYAKLLRSDDPNERDRGRQAIADFNPEAGW